MINAIAGDDQELYESSGRTVFNLCQCREVIAHDWQLKCHRSTDTQQWERTRNFNQLHLNQYNVQNPEVIKNCANLSWACKTKSIDSNSGSKKNTYFGDEMSPKHFLNFYWSQMRTKGWQRWRRCMWLSPQVPNDHTRAWDSQDWDRWGDASLSVAAYLQVVRLSVTRRWQPCPVLCQTSFLVFVAATTGDEPSEASHADTLHVKWNTFHYSY